MKKGKYIIELFYLVALIGLVSSLIAIPVSLIYMIWISLEIGVKILLTSFVVMGTSFALGRFGEDAYDEFYKSDKDSTSTKNGENQQ